MTNICIGLKMTCLGVLEKGDRDKYNETGLKEGRGIEMSTTVLPLRDARLNTYLLLFGVVSEELVVVVFCILFNVLLKDRTELMQRLTCEIRLMIKTVYTIKFSIFSTFTLLQNGFLRFNELLPRVETNNLQKKKKK